MLDAVFEGSLCSNEPYAAQNLIHKMTTNDYQWSSKKNNLIKEATIYEVGILTTLATEVKAITKRSDTLQMPSQALAMACDVWGPYIGQSSSSTDLCAKSSK